MKDLKLTLIFAAGCLLAAATVAARESVQYSPRVIAKHASGCIAPSARIDLDVNNVRLRLLSGGDHWYDYVAQSNHYEIPKGSGKHSLYAGALWVGGVDNFGKLKTACQTYRQTGNDFFSGPLNTDNASIDPSRCNHYDRMWKISRQQVLDFIGDPKAPAPNMDNATPDIKAWPGNGDPSFKEGEFLAPFFDANSDNLYNAEDGDYPYYFFEQSFPGNVCNDYLFGDESIWWVLNDNGGPHAFSKGDPIGLEIQAQAFAYSTDDEVNNMTFYKYKLINRSQERLNQTYFGVWVDPDLGYAYDDYVGCDVNLGLGFVYNGDNFDDGLSGYGANPPALGVDFFQGPLADSNDGIDNDKDGTTDEPGEQIIMSKFLYYYNNANALNGEPNEAKDFYNYLRGLWLDGSPMTCDGANGTSPNAAPTDYMFPGTTNTYNTGCTDNWTEYTAHNAPEDRRFLISAGPFSLEPGAVNYITTGVVWAKASNGGPEASIAAVKIADAKAQSLFDNCFNIVDGPSSPDVAVRELDKQLIFSFQNYATDKVEKYEELDATIPALIYINGQPVHIDESERKYRFQGYQVFQLKDALVTLADLGNVDRARLVMQCDKADSITNIINFNWNDDIGYYEPEMKVEGANKGLIHSFSINNDAFATGTSQLVNYRTYYFVVLSYAENNFYPFNPGIPYPLNPTQAKPYLRGRNNVQIIQAVPHHPLPENLGTVIQSSYGQQFAITRLEGQGNGNIALDMDDQSVEEALAAPDYRCYFPTYTAAHAPVKVKITDPIWVHDNVYTLALQGLDNHAMWSLLNSRKGTTIGSEVPISVQNEQIFARDGFSISLQNTSAPFDSLNNDGLIEASLTYNGSVQWLAFIKDNANRVTENWIKLSKDDSVRHAPFANVLGATVSPFVFVRGSSDSYAPFIPAPAYEPDSQAIASVDIVFTADKSKWTRCPVLEIQGTPTQTIPVGIKKLGLRGSASIDKNGQQNFPSPDNDDFPSGMGWFPGYAINIETGERLNMAYGENSAIDHDMIFNPSELMYDGTKPVLGGGHYVYVFNHVYNGVNHMPRYDYGAYMYGKLATLSADDKKMLFRECIWVTCPLAASGKAWLSNDAKIRLRVAKPFAQYDTRPELFAGEALTSQQTYTVVVSSITYNNNVYQPGQQFVAQGGTFTGNGSVVGGNYQNNALPLYRFGTAKQMALLHNDSALHQVLAMINIVPNPYYAYSEYERNQLENTMKITNLPAKCVVSIYALNGQLLRKYKRDAPTDNSLAGVVEEPIYDTSISWNLKNSKGIPVASGMYLIHVDVPGIGTRTLHAMVIMRAVDVDTF